jgi:hypothetical protein
MKLYVDGVMVVQNTGVTTAQNYTGYWRIGWDALTGWWPLFQTGSDYFGGSVSNAAVYTTKALSDAQIWDHYVAGAITTTGPVVAATSINASAQASGLSVRTTPPARRSAAPSAAVTPSATPAAGPSATPSITPAVDSSVTPSVLPAPTWSVLPSVIPVPSWSAAPSIPASIAGVAPTPVLPTSSLPESVTPSPAE